MSAIIERLSAALADRYRIIRELGQGGMATVYLAEDLKHDRKVALKVLKPELAAVLGAERFVVEIKTTAALQHPHILPLFDSGTADGFLYYVMPFIDGETLRSKLDRETQLGIEEAVLITSNIADALDYAHRHGVIHRDIKPENILLHDGRPMVADFGIALAVSAAAGGRMTETGLSLGTPHYMSPEQATAEKEITGRSDVYSLASMLYEMLTGNPPHMGASAQQIIMKIITEQAPSVTTLRKSVPSHIAAAVAKALEKLPADRFASARAFADALRDERFAHGSVAGTAAAPAHGLGMAASRRALYAGSALAVLGIAVGAWGWQRAPVAASGEPVQLALDVDGSDPDLMRFGVSHDGATFVFTSDEGLRIRPAGEREFRLLAGTEHAETPNFSPEGDWILFTRSGQLRKIALRGGSALALIPGDTILGSAPHWGEDGSIVFETADGLALLPAGGGALRILSGAQPAASPRMLPDGSGVLYVDNSTGSRLMLFDLASGTTTMLVEEAAAGQYVEGGQIVYGHPAGGLFAVAFDLARHRLTGSPIPVVDDVEINGAVSPFVVSRNGTLVFRAGVRAEDRLITLGPGRRIDTLPITPQTFSYARFSPDGRLLAVTVGSARGMNRHTAIHDLEFGSMRQLTFEGGGHGPVWSPDGRKIAYTAESAESDAEDLFVREADGTGKPRQLLRIPQDQHANAWPTDDALLFSDGGTVAVRIAGGDLRVIDPTAAAPVARAYLDAQWPEFDVSVSPDGRFAAYTSNEAGSQQVYVRTYPVPGAPWKISESGGRSPRWSPDGRTIFYRSSDYAAIEAARVSTASGVAVVGRERVSSLPGLGAAWDVNPRTGLIVVSQSVGTVNRRMIVVVNWLEALRRATRAAPPTQ